MKSCKERQIMGYQTMTIRQQICSNRNPGKAVKPDEFVLTALAE